MAADPKADAKPNELRGTLPPGTRLRNYELVSVLGHGGFGITYYARDTTLDREVAIKEYLPTSLALREDATMVVPRSTHLAEDFVWGRERFLEEARILATLEGVPSVVRVYDFLEANGTAYMVMALARGETLEERLKRDGPQPAAIVERLLTRLLDGLEEVHKAGFLHRDVKPANIILNANSNPTLIDFGASRAAMADRTSALTAIFTPRYAAAEQLTSAKQGPWTDIYGLSATLHHAITGHAPPSSLERALNDAYEPLASLAPAGFSPAILQGIDAGLAVRAQDRPQSIAAWRDILFATQTEAADATVLASRPKPKRAEEPAAPAVSQPARAEPERPTPVREAATASKNRIVWYGGLAAAMVVLAVGFYLGMVAKPVPTPSQDVKVQAEAEQKAAAEAEQTAAADSQRKAEAEAQQKAAAEAQQRAAAEAQRKAEVEAQQKAAAEAQQKAAVEAQQKAELEAQRKAAAEAQQKAAAEAQQKAAAEAQQKAAADAQRKAEVEAQQKAAAEAQQKAATEAEQKAADAAALKTAEASEAALQLTTADRQRLQVALTSLGFDTQGADGVFGPRTRQMILGWQQARSQSATGFLTAPQRQALLGEAASALAKYDADLKRAEEARRKAAEAPAPPFNRPSIINGVSCQDASGRRIDFPNATSCPYGLNAVR